MSLLSEIKTIVESCGLSIETGVFSDAPPKQYAVITPLADTFELDADDLPNYETQEVRISLFSKENYTRLKNELVRSLLRSEFTITDRRYVGHENDTGYHHYAIDVAKIYETEVI